MSKDHADGLMLIIAGLYIVIRFRYLAKEGLKRRINITRLLYFRKGKDHISKSDIIFAEIINIVGGAFFILVGLAKFST
jgi:hypothetical protein